jgi:acyl-CoA synthetase (AMP-forming)/AMP-acid ligase II
VAIEILGELPKNALGKIDKPALRELAQRQPM